MSPRIYVERLTSSVMDMWSRLLRAPERTVTSACVIKIKTSGQPLGNQFVEIGLSEKAEEITMAFNRNRLKERRLDLFSGQYTRWSPPSTGEEMKGGELCAPFLSSSLLWR
jgi:hypothetical protein